MKVLKSNDSSNNFTNGIKAPLKSYDFIKTDNDDDNYDNYESNIIKSGTIQNKPNKRSNSIKLYKKQKQKQKQEKNQNNNNIAVELLNVDMNNSDTIKKNKKNVKFQYPNFVETIEVESYKKFNSENTYKDPFDGCTDINEINKVYDMDDEDDDVNPIRKIYQSCCRCNIF